MFPRSHILASASAMARSVTTPSLSAFKDLLTSIKPNVKDISVAQLSAKLRADPVRGLPHNVHLLDVRETYEWNESHIPQARYTGRGCLERDIEDVIPDFADEVIVYCAGGSRSVLAADALQRMGYKNVFNLAGGIGAWKAAGLPITQNFNTYSERVESY